jgi:exosortase
MAPMVTMTLTPGRRTAVFGAYCLCVIVANLGALRALAALAQRDATASHVLLVPFVTLVLIVQQRDALFKSARWDWQAGLGVIAAGLGLLWIAVSLYRPSGGHDDSLSWITAALVVLWIGGFVLVYGRTASRTALFPLAYLGFMVPIPGAVLDGAVRLLKTGSADMVAALFTLTGTTYHREGFVFTLPNVVIEVADECSGIRSSLALLMTILLAGHMFLTSAWKKAVLVLAIVPLTIVKNGIRIVSLTLLAVHVNPGFLTGQLHHEGGIVFFLLALLLLSPLFHVLRKSEPDYRVTRS